jgi:hypothetical protein
MWGCWFGTTPMSSEVHGNGLGTKAKPSVFGSRRRLLLFVRSTRAAGSDEGHSRTKSPKAKNRPADDDCTNKRPDNYFGPSAGASLVTNKVARNAAKHGTNYSRDL